MPPSRLNFRALFVPLVLLLICCVFVGSWTIRSSFWGTEGFDSPSTAVRVDSSVLAAVDSKPAMIPVDAASQSKPSIPPLVVPVPANPPPGVMTTPGNASVSRVPSQLVSTPFPTLTGTNTPLVDPRVSQLPTTLPDSVQSIPPVPPVIPGAVLYTGDRSSNLTPGLVRVNPTTDYQRSQFAATNPVLLPDATAPALPVSEPSFPPALAPGNLDANKPYVDTSKQSYALQQYAPLFDELDDVQMQLSDNIQHLKSINNKIKAQYVPEFPVPLVERFNVNAGY